MSSANIKHYLSPDECRAIVRALEVAADQYRRDANTDDQLMETFREMQRVASRLAEFLQEEPLAVLA